MKKHCFLVRNLMIIAFYLLISIEITHGQTCTVTTPANPGSLTGTNFSGVNINISDGKVSWFTGGTLGGANINISSNSTLIIKSGSFLTLTGATTIPAGSTIYIESGASISLPGSLTVQGNLINLGTLTITGSNNLQLNGGAVYNDGTIVATSSYLYLFNSASFTFSNGGSASFTYVTWQITTGTNPVCLRPGSILNLISFPNAYPITGTGTLPTGGLFQYNSTDISSNSTCTPANPARINYYEPNSGANNGSVVFGPTGKFSNNANITVVGNNPAPSGSEFGVSTRVTSGTGYSNSTPNTYVLTTQSPVPAVTGNYFQYCLNSTVPLSSMASGTNLLWYTSATGGTGSSTAPTVVTTSAGLQTFWVSQNITGSCEGPRNPININISSTAANTLSAGNNGPVCAGGTLTLSATATGISSWSWTGPNNYTSTSQNPTVSVSATTAMSGTYIIIANQTTGSCSNSATTTVTVSSSTPAQPAAFTTSSSTVCPGQSAVSYIVPAVTGATSYNWSYSGTGATITGTTNAVTISFSSVATSGTLSVTASNTCGTSTARTLSITVNPIIYQVSTTGLIAYYKFNGNANDETNNDQGTLQNSPTATSDRFGNANSAYSFNGTTQFVSTANSYVNPTTFTVSIWFKTALGGGRLIGFGSSQTGGSGPSTRDRTVYMSNTGQLYFGVYNATGPTYNAINTSTSYNDNQWHLVTATFSNANGSALYVDGSLAASNAGYNIVGNYTGYWKIGFENLGSWPSNPSSNYFNGNLDDAIIYQKELTSSEVTTLYTSFDGAGNSAPVCQGGTLNLTAPTITGATYSWTGPSSFSNASQNTSVSNMASANVGTYTLTITAPGACSYTAYVLGTINYNLGPNISLLPSTGLQSHYKLNGNANDDLNYNPGVLQFNPTSTTDRFGNANAAYSFDGATQFIYTTTPITTNPSIFTLSTWFNTSTTNGGLLLGFGNSQSGSSGIKDRHIYMANNGIIYFGTYNGGYKEIYSTSSYNDGTWHLVTATFSGTNGMNLYMDGALVASNATYNVAQTNNPGYWRIAYDAVGSPPAVPSSNYFNGSMDDILIYTSELTAAQVTTLYNSSGGAGQNGPVCLGSTLTFSSATISGATYSWTGPNSFSSAAQNPTLTYIAADAGTYKVVVSSAGCTSTGYTTVTSNTTTPGLWTGNTSTSWATGSNWCGGSVPTSTTDVTIPAVATLPINSATANARNLTINASATLTNSTTGILNLYGNFTNNGTFTDNSIYTSAGVINFVGTSAQTITGATTFSNVTINNSSGVTLSSAATINGILTLTTGTFATGGNLNQNLYNGAIAGTGAGTTTGNIRFFKTIWGDRYHYLSSPITGRTAADWNDNVTIKFGANANLYSYNEALNDTNQKVGWTAFTTTATSLQDVTGYALFFPRWIYTTTLDVAGPYTHSATFTSPTLTNTPCTIPVAKPSSDGWNLVGNPYPSTLDWTIASGWTKPALLNNAVYMWNGRTNKYTSYVSGVGTNGGTQYIGSMQGFFVKMAAGGSGTLTVNNNARITSTLIDVWRTESSTNVLRINAAIDTLSDETVIRFIDGATESFDGQLDAYKLYNTGNTPSLSSVAASENYSINSLPTSLMQKTIPLQLIATLSGNYSFTADLSSLSTNSSVILEDRLLGITQDLSLNPTYTTALSKGDYQGRFFINYNQKQSTVAGTTAGASKDFEIEISAYQQNVFILFANQTTGSANIAVFDAVGKKVYALDNTTINEGRIDFNLPNSEGIYIVKVQTTTANNAKQVVIQK